MFISRHLRRAEPSRAGVDPSSQTIASSDLSKEVAGRRLYLPLLVFCGLAAAISWTLWLPLVLIGAGATGSWRYLHLVGALGPAVAGLACAWWFGGKPALTLVLQRIVLWRVSAGWHLVAWLSPFGLLALAILVENFIGGEQAGGLFTRGPEFPELPLVAYWIVVLVFYGFGEEIGWRGFALPLLQSHFAPLPATLILSVVWAAWHLPLFFFSPGLSSMGIGGIAGWYASLVTGAAILTWLTNSTRGSILLAAAFHATMDLAFSPSISPVATTLIGAAVTVWGVFAVGWLLLPSRARSTLLPGIP
jgi:uncharacterized protein